MGYTHYFQQKTHLSDSVWTQITDDAQKIMAFANLHYNIELVSDDCNKKIITAQRINLNDKYDSHETFYLPKKDSQFNFCKTAQKSYDLIVCAILLVAHHYAPGAYEITSDGTAEDWSQSSQLNARALGYAYLLPPTLQDNYSPAIEAESADIARSHIPSINTFEKEEIEKTIKSSRFKF